MDNGTILQTVSVISECQLFPRADGTNPCKVKVLADEGSWSSSTELGLDPGSGCRIEIPRNEAQSEKSLRSVVFFKLNAASGFRRVLLALVMYGTTPFSGWVYNRNDDTNYEPSPDTDLWLFPEHVDSDESGKLVTQFRIPKRPESGDYVLMCKSGDTEAEFKLA